MRDSRSQDKMTGYNLEIGLKSEQEQKRKGEENKRKMLDTLDQQLRIKEEEKHYQKAH